MSDECCGVVSECAQSGMLLLNSEYVVLGKDIPECLANKPINSQDTKKTHCRFI